MASAPSVLGIQQPAGRQHGGGGRRDLGETAVVAGAVPPAVSINVLMDRSHPIRSAVLDVEDTLLIAIGLVILVIFLFLRIGVGDPHSGAGGADLVCSAPSA